VKKPAEVVLAPKLLRFEQGKAVTSQDVLPTAILLEKFAWSEFLQSAEFAGHVADETDRSAIFSAIQSLHGMLPSAFELLDILKGGPEKKLRVLARTDIAAGALRMAPLLTHPMRVASACNQGWAPAARVKRSGLPGKEFYLTATANMPPLAPAALSASAAAEGSEILASEGSFAAHSWKLGHMPWPFWIVTRTDKDSGFNCSLDSACIQSVQTCSSSSVGEPIVSTCEVEVPVMSNIVSIKAGEEIVVYWPSAKKDTKTEKKPTTYVHQAAKRLRKA